MTSRIIFFASLYPIEANADDDPNSPTLRVLENQFLICGGSRSLNSYQVKALLYLTVK